MFESLAAFYNSEIWRKFRLSLIAERTNKADGILYCEYSGVPLLSSFDIVAHHKQQLTTANVNDFDISLNPENIMLVSQRAHNEIHSRFGYSTKRKIYLVYGAPCSGKSSFVNSVKGNSDIVVDKDNIWQCITGGQRYFKPNALKTVMFQINKQLLDMVKMHVGNWDRAYIITGGTLKSERDDLITKLGAEPIYIDTDKETCLQRLANDTERAHVQKEWQGYIENWFKEFQP